MVSITLDQAENIFVNGLRSVLSDSNRLDINMSSIGVRASDSYWIGKGWATDPNTGNYGRSRWEEWGLPQVQVFNIQTRKEHEDQEGTQTWTSIFQVDIFATGNSEKMRLAEEARNLLEKSQRNSLNASGLKIDDIINDFDSIADERIPDDVYRRTITYRVFFQTAR